MTSGTTKYSTDQIMEMLYHFEKASIGKASFSGDQKKIAAKLEKNRISLNRYTHFVATQKEPSR